MNIQEIHDFMDFVTDKEQVGMITPSDKDMALDRASIMEFKRLLPYYAIDQGMTDALAPFKTSFTFTNSTSPTGTVTLPTDYMRFLSVMVMQFDNETGENRYEEIDFVNSDELAYRTRSQLRPITQNKPVGHWIGKGKFQLYPQKASVGQAWYLKRPAKPFYAFTQEERTLVYNSAGSTQLEWAEPEQNTVILRALQLCGVNLSDEQMIQYTQLKISEA